MSWIASLMVTLLKPQLRQSTTVTKIANASSGRDDGGGGTMFCSVMRRQRSRQWEQTPAISINGLLAEKPAVRDAAFSASATSPLGASPTAPQRSQIRNTTRSSSV